MIRTFTHVCVLATGLHLCNAVKSINNFFLFKRYCSSSLKVYYQFPTVDYIQNYQVTYPKDKKVFELPNHKAVIEFICKSATFWYGANTVPPYHRPHNLPV